MGGLEPPPPPGYAAVGLALTVFVIASFYQVALARRNKEIFWASSQAANSQLPISAQGLVMKTVLFCGHGIILPKNNQIKSNITYKLHDVYTHLRWIYTVSVLCPLLPVFLRFRFSVKKYAIFHPHFYVYICAQTRQSHTGQKFSEKKFL